MVLTYMRHWSPTVVRLHHEPASDLFLKHCQNPVIGKSLGSGNVAVQNRV